MHLKCILLIFSCHLTECLAKKFITENLIENNIVACFASVMKRFYHNSTVVFPLAVSRKLQRSQSLLLHMNPEESEVIISELKTEILYAIRNIEEQVFAIKISTVEELLSVISVDLRYQIWTIHTKFVIVLNQYRPDESYLVEIVRCLSSRNILNFIIISPLCFNCSYGKIHTWYPFAENSCIEAFDKIQTIGHCNEGNASLERDPFSGKIPENFSNCFVKIGAGGVPPYNIITKNNKNIFTGIEMDILQLVMDKLLVRYSQQYKPYYWGSIFSNGSATENLFLLLNKDIDIAMGGYGGSSEILRYADLLDHHFVESVTWIVPHAGFVDRWKAIIDAMGRDMFVIGVISSLIFSLTSWLMCCTLGEDLQSFTGTASIFTAVRILLGWSVPVFPNSTSMRTLSVTYTFFSMIWVIRYAALLTTMMTHPNMEPQIETISDILQSGLNVFMLTHTNRYGMNNNNSNSVFRKITARGWKLCTNLTFCLDNAATTRTIAMRVPRIPADYYRGRYLDENALPVLYLFKINVAVFPLHFIARKGFYLGQAINKVLRRVKAAGLVKKFKETYLPHTQADYPGVRTATVMRLEDFRLPFFVLTSGLLLSLCAFVVELAVWFVINRKNI